ncbi:MAG: efflux RND transporter periplasmic adaptor subunit [Nostocales cyanobacterium 94392]|nr:efflux RND transporter periplasmic adaptor subunit [Nostocales cyanobacterium 94392]
MPYKKEISRQNNYEIFSSSGRWIACLLSLGLLSSSCASFPKESAEAQSQRRGRGGQTSRPTAVDVAIARTDSLQKSQPLTGSTTPFRTVSLRSQVEGRLLGLNVDVGDRVNQGQVIGQVDDTLLRTTINQAEAELASLKSEVARINAQISNARTEVERTRLELQQIQADSQRQQKLAAQGAIAKQTAEQARTEAQTATQLLRAAQESVQVQQQALAAAEGRVVAQQAVVAQAQERRSYARLTSPINGAIIERSTEPGNLLQPGNEILKIGDFNRVKVEVQVSELELSKIQVGQSVEVGLDAFPNQTYYGTVTRISPAADPTARLVPVEIVIPNNNRQIGSGLLARVNFTSSEQPNVVVPETALQRDRNSKSSSEKNSNQNSQGTIFVLNSSAEKPTVSARQVTIGKKNDGKVEILSGLQPGERFVVRSGEPLKQNAAVRLSIISEKPESTEN